MSPISCRRRRDRKLESFASAGCRFWNERPGAMCDIGDQKKGYKVPKYQLQLVIGVGFVFIEAKDRADAAEKAPEVFKKMRRRAFGSVQYNLIRMKDSCTKSTSRS